jgi:hypothetical protein
MAGFACGNYGSGVDSGGLCIIVFKAPTRRRLRPCMLHCSVCCEYGRPRSCRRAGRQAVRLRWLTARHTPGARVAPQCLIYPTGRYACELATGERERVCCHNGRDCFTCAVETCQGPRICSPANDACSPVVSCCRRLGKCRRSIFQCPHPKSEAGHVLSEVF